MTGPDSGAGSGSRAVRIDLVSDVVCPWCYVGFRSFLTAWKSRPDTEIALTFRAFQLDPEMPREGAPRMDRILAKFGGDVARLAEATGAVSAAGRQVGIDFAFDRIVRTPNTLDSHRILHWATGAGHGIACAEALFRAYFVDGRDLCDLETLAAIAGSAGLDGAIVRELLDTDTDSDMVLEEIATARRMGVTGVPCFIFDTGFAVTGAQSPATFVQALDRARAG